MFDVYINVLFVIFDTVGACAMDTLPKQSKEFCDRFSCLLVDSFCLLTPSLGKLSIKIKQANTKLTEANTCFLPAVAA